MLSLILCISVYATCILCFSPQGIGDLTLASQCFKLALAFNNDHAEAYNNLAVLELRKGHIEQVNELGFLDLQIYHFDQMIVLIRVLSMNLF